MSFEKLRRLILMPLIGLIFATTSLTTPLLTTPVYADPDTTNTTPDPDPSGNTTDNDSSTSLDEERTGSSSSTSNPGRATNDDSSTSLDEERTERGSASPSATTPVATGVVDATRDETSDESSSEGTTCMDQVGAIGWLVCPTTGFLANAIDSLYGAIEGLLVVQPLSNDTNTPIFIVWNYARNISNIVFVILILVVIYSQLTGIGLNNYSIKKILPRIIIAAILVNLSFLITSLAVDVSNILGLSVRNFLNGVGETAISSGAIHPEASINVSDVFAAVAAGGTILGISVAASGGVVSLLFLIIPVIIGALISVATGLLTISLRQAVIALLVMISPLAFVAYLLPNTEKYFKKWFDLFVQMIIFYPMFSLLFGASRLAGWVLISGANNGLGLILGIAVQIFPLFFGVSLMKMSGTVLGTINGFFAGLGTRATKASQGYFGELRANRRARYLAETPKKFDIPRRAAQNFTDRRRRRAIDTAELQKRIEERGTAYTHQTYFRSDGQVSRRGERHADNINTSMEHQRIVTRANNNFDEGLAQFSKEGSRIHKRAKALDEAGMRASERLKYEQARTADINLENLKSYHQRVNEAINANARKGFNQDYDKDAYDRYQEILGITGNRGENGVNTIFANALAQKARADREIKGDYELLLQEAAYTANIDDMLEAALKTKDPNIMSAAIETMMTRGDTDLIGDKLEELTSQIAGDSPEDLAMQKRLSDTMVKYKGDSAILWGYAKCLNMARGRAESMRRKNRKIEAANKAAIEAGHPEQVQALLEVIPDFFPFDDYLKSDGEAAKWGLDIKSMIKSADESIGGTQDRTAWSFTKDRDELYYTETQRRNALFGGVQVTGEKLLSLIDMHLGRGASWNYSENGQSVSTKSNRQVLSFQAVTHIDDNGNVVVDKTAEEALRDARSNIEAMVKGNNAGHFTKFKSDILTAFGAVMSDDYTIASDGTIVFDLRQNRDGKIRSGLQTMVDDGTIDKEKISTDLRRLAKRGALNSMNSATRATLNSVLDFDE